MRWCLDRYDSGNPEKQKVYEFKVIHAVMEDDKILIYTGSDGLTKVEVRLEDDTLWLTQAQMCELYATSKSNVSEHIKHIFEDGELAAESVVRNFRTTAADGKSYSTSYYNLDMIIALGYRVRSIIATRFRQWATLRLKEYMQKGFTLDDDRLKRLGGGGYWKELLARIRDIRATEKVFYRQVLEIYATSIDYDPRASVSQEFFKKVQNKIHYAIHGNTAAGAPASEKSIFRRRSVSRSKATSSSPWASSATAATRRSGRKGLRICSTRCTSQRSIWRTKSSS